jgi:hypothetical protein
MLKQCLAENQARLWAWEIEYESARNDHNGVAANSYVHRIVAAKAPDRYFHWSAHGTPWMESWEDPYQQRLYVSSNRMISERPLHRLYSEHSLGPSDTLPGTASEELLLVALGWWPLAERPSATLVDEMPSALAKVACSSAYQARSRLEQLGEWRCQVLECPGRDCLWLDIERGCTLVARQISYPVQARVHRIEFSSFREMLPDFWAPYTIRNIHYHRSSDGTLGELIFESTLIIKRIRLNEDVEDARFVFQVRPGSVARIEDGPPRQTATGGEEYLDEVAEWVSRFSPQSTSRNSSTSWFKWSDVAVGAFLGGILIWALARRYPHVRRTNAKV